MKDIQAKREGACRARRLAWQVSDPADRARMLAFAQELEAQADVLEDDEDAPLRLVSQSQTQAQ